MVLPEEIRSRLAHSKASMMGCQRAKLDRQDVPSITRFVLAATADIAERKPIRGATMMLSPIQTELKILS